MSTKFDRKNNQLTIDCDSPGCHTNHECEPGVFKDGWREAQALGWVYVPYYGKGVSEPRHYCPEHAKQFG